MTTKSDLTEEVRRLVVANPNLLVPHYLIHSYLYYELDTAVISDSFYEDICKMLAGKWDTISHRHKHIIDRSSLTAGTGYYLKSEDYPGLVKGAACMTVEDLNNRTRRKKRGRKASA